MVASTLAADGGLPVAVGRLAALLKGRGISVTVVGPLGSSVCESITGSGAAVTALPGGLESLTAVRTMWRSRRGVHEPMASPRYTPLPIVHIHGVWTPLVIAAALAAMRSRTPYIVSPHGMLMGPAMRKSRLRKQLAIALLVRRMLTRARVVHCASPEEAAAVHQVAPAAVTCTIPFGVDTPSMPAGGAQGRPTTAGYLGRLVAIKNLEGLVEAWAATRPYGWRLRIAGPDGDGTRARLQAVIEQNSLQGLVSLEPPMSATAAQDFLASLALFIQPSRSENFGMAIAEALAASTPVITTTGTPWHAVAARRCGWCVDPSVQGLVTAIREATATPMADLAAMGQRGSEWITTEYSWSAVGPRFLRELYDLS
jgi:glycosyltransferase involved in cell wall biosynthesis